MGKTRPRTKLLISLDYDGGGIMSPNGLRSKDLAINLFKFIREFAGLKQKPDRF